MQVKQLKEILGILSQYAGEGDYVAAEHDELFLSYAGTLSKDHFNVLNEMGVSFGDYQASDITYEEYLSEDEDNKGSISFYV